MYIHILGLLNLCRCTIFCRIVNDGSRVVISNLRIIRLVCDNNGDDDDCKDSNDKNKNDNDHLSLFLTSMTIF